MKILKSTLLLFITALSLACNDSKNQNAAIELNDGQKWTVNTEMTPLIEKNEQLVNNYDQNDYETLAQNLKDNNSKLIKSCTMEGKSHHELHKWLHPHLELVKALGKANNEKEAQEIVEGLKDSFETYNKYFQ